MTARSATLDLEASELATTMTAAHVERHSLETPAPTPRRQIFRLPLVPQAILREHEARIAADTRFRASARLLQSLWRQDTGLPPGLFSLPEGIKSLPLGWRLDPDAARAGQNFIAPEIHALARREVILCEEGAAIDEERLFGNLLSSMPLTFNLLGHIALDPVGLGSRVFRQLLPAFVHQVERVSFETSPGRREARFLNDGTAFDAAIHVITPDGEPATVFIEVKYSEGMAGPVATPRPRYDAAARQVRLYRDPESPALRTPALEQFWREHMLAQLTVDQGITSRALFVAIGPSLNRRFTAACRLYTAELADPAPKDDVDRVGFTVLTLEAFVAALHAADASVAANALHDRYLAFDRVVATALNGIPDPGPCPPVPPSPSAPAAAAEPLENVTSSLRSVQRADEKLSQPTPSSPTSVKRLVRRSPRTSGGVRTRSRNAVRGGRR